MPFPPPPEVFATTNRSANYIPRIAARTVLLTVLCILKKKHALPTRVRRKLFDFIVEGGCRPSVSEVMQFGDITGHFHPETPNQRRLDDELFVVCRVDLTTVSVGITSTRFMQLLRTVEMNAPAASSPVLCRYPIPTHRLGHVLVLDCRNPYYKDWFLPFLDEPGGRDRSLAYGLQRVRLRRRRRTGTASIAVADRDAKRLKK